ncbi:NADPH-dependent FMN reductase [Roseinatronobacter bogoriensis]|uniref:NAD(P)H-dependent oxidoreductase n=1 Tax=Roseinatronobacter bogoriensis subsp. barguzinensis TaxID=441209 RepID=A0A2K8K7L2_9RHOB|nr:MULTISPECIES: NADPH-dependent FMN reductase [Rhodobaca]ATX65452.1 NAD(P)H-dependent oxidoreductase [Rhodobaca barguzinensis]MBB4209042.1 chromate reductase [Rhodobaca bogoriensis DSM 18756]TDW37532.1 chromate reductase [Rhodobaca barguzinensis]TDY68143.1 chromate reductase [Rhodobaca bogoriensis DSM 18756]
MSDLKLVGLCGSLRKESWNRKLMHAAKDAFGPAEFTEGNLRLPLFDEDLEAQGMPAEVTQLKELIANADAVVIACPEYNKAPPGVLKNALDWLSRGGAPWKDKPVAIVSAAAGRAGGERTQFALRLMMVAFRPNLLQGPEMLLSNPSKAFDDQGNLTDEVAAKLLKELMQDLRSVAGSRSD